MTNEIMIAGFGGQGVMAIGKTLAEAGMKEGKDVSWLPSYGPEMRGGTANCCVVISSEPIICPIVLEPTELIAMNLPSLLKFEPTVVPNMVMLGAYIEAMGNLGTETIKEMLVHMFTGPKAKLVDLNIEALRRGAACVR